MLNNLLLISIQGAILAGIVLCVTFFGRKVLSANTQFLLWSVVLLRFLLPFSPESSVSLYGLLTPPAKEAALVPQPVMVPEVAEITPPLIFAPKELPDVQASEPAPTADVVVPVVAQAKPLSTGVSHFSFLISHFIPFVWLCGVIILVLKIFRDEFTFLRQRRRWTEVRSGPIGELAAECHKQLGLRRKVRLFLCPEKLGAASYGIFAPAVVLSEEIGERYSPAELRLILLHELMHHMRFDPLTNLLVRLVVAVHWPNPFAWLVSSRLRTARELAVDESILRRTGEKSANLYGSVILKTVRHYALVLPAPNLLGVRSLDPILERRINMILQKRKATLLRTTLALSLVAALAITGLTRPVVTAQSKEPGVERSATPGLDQSTLKENEILLQGRVVDNDDNPMPRAKLYFFTNHFCTDDIFADADGKFSVPFPKEEAENWQAIVFSQDEKFMCWADSQYTEGFPDNLKLTVWPLDDPRIITGTVVDSQGKPVAGTWVGGGEDAPLPHVFKTDSEGKFRFPYNKGQSLVQLFAMKPGTGFTYFVTGEPYSWEGKSSEEPSNGPFHLTLEPPQTVRVKAVDEQGTPLPGVYATIDSLHTTTNQEQQKMSDWFNPCSLGPIGFTQRTNLDGIATFDWIPGKTLKTLYVQAAGPKAPITLADGTTKCFGESERMKWNPDEPVVTCVVPSMARVNVKVFNPDGTRAANYDFPTQWKTTRSLAGQMISTDKNGEATIYANIGDQFDALIVSSDSRRQGLVFQTICGFEVGDGKEEQELVIHLQKGTKIQATVLDQDGKPLDWEKEYHITAQEINPNFAEPKNNTSFGIRGEGASFTAFVAPGTFEFTLAPKWEFREKILLGDKQQITITDQEEVNLELRLK